MNIHHLLAHRDAETNSKVRFNIPNSKSQDHPHDDKYPRIKATIKDYGCIKPFYYGRTKSGV
jgi:hypothetical protein